MKKAKKKYSLTPEECKCDLVDFYKIAAEKMGLTKITDKTLYDCRKIHITKSVQDCIWKHYYDKGYSNAEIAAIMLHVGPKASLSGNELMFTVEDDFVMEID